MQNLEDVWFPPTRTPIDFWILNQTLLGTLLGIGSYQLPPPIFVGLKIHIVPGINPSCKFEASTFNNRNEFSENPRSMQIGGDRRRWWVWVNWMRVWADLKHYIEVGLNNTHHSEEFGTPLASPSCRLRVTRWKHQASWQLGSKGESYHNSTHELFASPSMKLQFFFLLENSSKV